IEVCLRWPGPSSRCSRKAPDCHRQRHQMRLRAGNDDLTESVGYSIRLDEQLFRQAETWTWLHFLRRFGSDPRRYFSHRCRTLPYLAQSDNSASCNGLRMSELISACSSSVKPSNKRLDFAVTIPAFCNVSNVPTTAANAELSLKMV